MRRKEWERRGVIHYDNNKKIFEGVIRYDESGNPQKIASTRQRAEEIFKVRKSFKQKKFTL